MYFRGYIGETGLEESKIGSCCNGPGKHNLVFSDDTKDEEKQKDLSYI